MDLVPSLSRVQTLAADFDSVKSTLNIRKDQLSRVLACSDKDLNQIWTLFHNHNVVLNAGMPVFLVNMALSGWIKFIMYKPAAITMTVIMAFGLAALTITFMRLVTHLVNSDQSGSKVIFCSLFTLLSHQYRNENFKAQALIITITDRSRLWEPSVKAMQAENFLSNVPKWASQVFCCVEMYGQQPVSERLWFGKKS